ncbi:MAG: hypothetical protein IKK09_04585 [Clostridia bacterium]|nr:hypothetical protein [Clostridia bacterium]
MIKEREINKYLKSVEKNIPCSKKIKKDCMQSLKLNIEDIISSDPNVTLSSLTEILGTPKAVADGFTSELDPKIIRKYKLIKNIACFTVFALLAVVTIAFLSNCIYDLTRLDYNFFLVRDLANTP